MLKGNPSVFHYTTFNTADKLFQQHPIWQQGRIEAERKLVFEEYVAELKQREVVGATFTVFIDQSKYLYSKNHAPLVHAVLAKSSRFSRTWMSMF